MKNLACIVLCAGQGTRMKSARSKMLQDLLGKPLCRWSIDLAQQLSPEHCLTVLGYQKDEVQKVLPPTVSGVYQEQQLGTGHAVQVAFKELSNFSGRVLVLYGDTPLLKFETLQKLLTVSSNSKIAMLTAKAENPFGYGRIVRDDSGKIQKIVEEKDASDAERRISEINPGIYVFDAQFLRDKLFNLKSNNQQKEFYLTDLVALAAGSVESVEVSEQEILGVNDYVQLAQVGRILQRRINEHWMRQGVQMLDFKTTYVGPEVELAPDVLLEQGVILRGKCQIASGARIKAYSVLEDSQVGTGCQIGPFAHLRPETVLEENCKIGNFVEVKKSHFKKNSKANHLAYIGDASVGHSCNIGAGTITCNYDGVKKHKTQIDDHVFVGSNSTLIAPVHLEEGSYVGAGSVINRDVPKNSLAIGRGRQENKDARALPRNRTV